MKATQSNCWRIFSLFVLLLLNISFASAQEVPHAAPGAPAAEAHGLPEAAPLLKDLQVGPFQISNSMVVTWIVSLVIIIFAQLATRNIQRVPQGLQNVVEWIVESLQNFLAGIMGEDLVKKTFWFFATIFIFILFANWFGLLPGIGTIGWGYVGAHGFHVTEPLLRGANADLNMTSAMALAFFACWIVWALQSNGAGGFVGHIFGYKGDATGFMKLFLILIFLAVGLLEVVSILFRPVSLSFRLYGNVFAGENILETMSHLGGDKIWLKALLPIPFYFLELIVGFVQALVFTLLTAVFTLLICQHDEEHAHAHTHAGGESHH